MLETAVKRPRTKKPGVFAAGDGQLRAETERLCQENARLRRHNEELRAESNRLREENARLQGENRALRSQIDAYVGRARSAALFGPLELSAGTCVGPRRP